MFDLTLTPEQIEMRDTLRDFAEREMKAAAIHPDRLQPFEKPVMTALLNKAAQLGIRTLALSEDAGGAGADNLTTCIVLEELASGEVDVATILGTTATLGHSLFDVLMTAEQKAKYVKAFAEDDDYHLAFAGTTRDAGTGWTYHRDAYDEDVMVPAAVKQGNEWVLNGRVEAVSNAPLAKLFAVQVRTDSKKTGMAGLSTFLIPRDTAGFKVLDTIKAFGGPENTLTRWHHGTAATIELKDCKVSAANLLGKEGKCPFADGKELARASVVSAAISIGVGRASYDAAVDYAKMRRQGGRNIMEHQAIGTKIADCTIKLELSRNMVWKAAWALDHPEAIAGRSVSELPLHVIARVASAEAVHEVTLLAAECFGAMGVMRDMPLQKYVNDGFIIAHSEDTDGAAKLQI
ncbi:MAG TPA: acyl-CoA dehydrogenase family protein, partial [Burkholderiales bacterium]|nr:acyl-CoA dehydrogenase family protein [Burkholderiales bacterium]